jgi:hypothetical protein
MITCAQSLSTVYLPTFSEPLKWREFMRVLVFTVCLFLPIGIACGQSGNTNSAEVKEVLISGVTNSTVFGLGETLRITGTVKQGAMSFGGDIIVEGIVEGDVATIGGSVIQKPGSRIGGDVIVLGGTYQPGDPAGLRNPAAMTMMYAGYQQELRDLVRSPTDLLSPRWTPVYLGTRFLVILFWFVISLAVTSAMPGTISRGVARLQLTSLRVAIIGFVGMIVLFVSVTGCLLLLPETVGVLIGIMTLLFGVVAGLFGRVILYAATGKWLQRKYIPVGRNSEAIALLIGTTFWVTLTSLPYIWPFVVTFIIVISLGLAFTARYRVNWRQPAN